jgi:hypothetical protein
MTQGRFASLILLIGCLSISAFAILGCPPSGSQYPGHKTGIAIPTPQTVGAWCVDEINGSDSNSGQSAGNCFKTVHQLNDAIWGCWGSPGGCPRLQQNTIITFYNAGDTGCVDPFILSPSLETGKYLALVGIPSACTSDTLGLVTVGGSATRTGLQLATLSTLDAGAAGMFLQETTVDGGGAEAGLGGQIKSLGWGIAPAVGQLSNGDASAQWMWSQPLSRTSYPGILNTPPAEQGNVWANADPVTYCTLPSVCIEKLAPVLEHAGAGMTNGSLYVSNLKIVAEAPVSDAGLPIAPMNLNANVQLFENYVGRPVFVAGADDGPAPQYFVNNYFASNVFVQGGAQSTWIVGGTVVGNVQGANIVLDGDTYLQGSQNVISPAAGNFSLASTAGLADAAVLNVFGAGTMLGVTNAYDAGQLWNNGTGGIINVMGASRAVYPKGAPGKLGTVLQLNSQQKACLMYPANPATTLVCNLALTPSTLDAAIDNDAGVGCLGVPGGGAFCNGDL